jgi:Protein kinase domain/AAA ATPase domain
MGIDTASSRYEVIRVLGQGGEGRVDLVFDRVRGQQVAMKRVASRDPASLLRLKKEFRSVEQISHPALVRLHELGQDAEGPFFTMEAVDGTTLDAYCVPPSPARSPARLEEPPTVPTDEAPTVRGPAAADTRRTASRAAAPAIRLDRLAQVLPGILDGLRALHAHGLVHRDLKPSNVLVSRAGEVKLLDFGILAELGAAGELAGTPAYMAPEQITGAPVSPATDLYALGAMLFRLVAGRPVFSGAMQLVLKQHVSAEAPSLAEACPEAPAAIVEACRALLAKDPAERPTIADLEATLLVALGVAPARGAARAHPRAPAAALVGREAPIGELMRLLAASRAGPFAVVVLRGATGVGKTALADLVAGEAAARGMVTLRGRGRPTERVPFNVIDGVIDGLAALLAPEEVGIEIAVGDEMGVAATAFPVLLQVGAPVRSSRRGPRRVEVFAALGSAFAKIAARRGGLLVVLDDLHWADEDSLALVEDLVGRAPPGVLVLATERDDVGPNAAADWVAREARLHRIEIPPLAEGEVMAVIARAAGALGARVPGADLGELARRAAGRPFLAEVLGRAFAFAGAAPREGRIDVTDAGALERAGRFREAARRWAELGAGAGAEERADAALHEAAALLGGSEVKEGHARLVTALRDAGEPPPRGIGIRAIWAALVFLRGPRAVPARPAGARALLPAHGRARAERDVRIGMLLSYFDPLAGLRFLLRARAAFDRAGAAEQAAYCDYIFAYYALFGDPTRRPVPLAERYLASARARLGDAVESAEVLAMPSVIEGFAALRLGEFDRAEPLLDAGLAELEGGGHTGAFAHLYALFNRCELDLARQDIHGLARTLRRMTDASRESGECSLRCQVTLMGAYLSAFRGDVDEAIARMAWLRGAWPERPPTMQRYLIEIVSLHFERPRTDPRALRERLARVFVERPFRLLRSAEAGLYAASAALIEVRARKSGDRGASLRAVDRYARIARAAPPVGSTGALRALAYAEELRGRPARALALLSEAEDEATRFGQAFDAAIARYQRGKRLGGEEGKRLRGEGREGLARCGGGAVWLDEDEV